MKTSDSGDGAGIFSANFQMLDALGGTAETETGQNSDLNNLYSYQYTGDNLHLQQWWQQCYDGIANANLSIEKIPTIPSIDEAYAKEVDWSGQIPPCVLLLLGGSTVGRRSAHHRRFILDGSRCERFTILRRRRFMTSSFRISWDAEAAGFDKTDNTGLASKMAGEIIVGKGLHYDGWLSFEQGIAVLSARGSQGEGVIDYSIANPV